MIIAGLATRTLAAEIQNSYTVFARITEQMRRADPKRQMDVDPIVSHVTVLPAAQRDNPAGQSFLPRGLADRRALLPACAPYSKACTADKRPWRRNGLAGSRWVLLMHTIDRSSHCMTSSNRHIRPAWGINVRISALINAAYYRDELLTFNSPPLWPQNG